MAAQVQAASGAITGTLTAAMGSAVNVLLALPSLVCHRGAGQSAKSRKPESGEQFHPKSKCWASTIADHVHWCHLSVLRIIEPLI
jgi:hypothetical protein